MLYACGKFNTVRIGTGISGNCEQKCTLNSKGKAVPQHTYGDAAGRVCIAPTL